MKRVDTLLSLILLTGFTTLLILACKKDHEEPEDPPVTNPVNTAMADTLANHLILAGATKKQGDAPPGPAVSSLRSSIRDTLRLTGYLPWPIKFLHMDPTKNIAGVWIQILAPGGTGASTFYYEVPELGDMKESDTISVITIGINPEGLDLPQTFQTKIVPYDKDKQPLAETIFPTKLDDPKVKLPGNGGACGLTLQSNEHWSWDASYISFVNPNGEFPFWNQPGKAFSSGGVDIEGSCCNGVSIWPAFCTGQLFHNKTLHFATYYTIKFENFWFLANNSFSRTTLEDSPLPSPAESDFCGNGAGRVKENLNLTDYSGTWEIKPVTAPANAATFIKGATHELILITTGGSGTGYGNPGGVIHHLDCEEGTLVMAQVRSGGSWTQPLVKFYSRARNGETKWYQLL